jgi:hypothetical protein
MTTGLMLPALRPMDDAGFDSIKFFSACGALAIASMPGMTIHCVAVLTPAE